MRKHFFQALFFIVSFSISAAAQEYQKLVKADSLAQENEFEGSINLINGVLNTNPRNFLKAQAYYQLSYVYLQLYELEKAWDFNKKSLALRDLLHYEFIADNTMQSGAIELRLGNLETALEYFLVAKELPHSSFQFSGALDAYIGAAYKQMGKSEQARENYRNALEIFKWEMGENHPLVAETHINLGYLYASTGDNVNALVHFDQTIAIELKSTKGKAIANPRLAKAYNARGLIVYKENSNSDEAISNFKNALMAAEGFSHLTAKSRFNIAQTLFVKRVFEQAKEEVGLALEILYNGERGRLGYNIPMIMDKELYINGLRLKSEILLEAFLKDHNADYLLKAFENCSLAIEISESRILDLHLKYNQSVLLQNSSSKDIYELAIYIALKLYEVTTDEKYQYEAFRFTEKSKALELKNKDKDFYEIYERDMPDDLKEDRQRIRNQLAFLETDIALKYHADNFEKETLNLYKDYEILLGKIEKYSPEYFGLRYRVPTINVADLQKQLTDDEAILSYYFGKEFYSIFAMDNIAVKSYLKAQNTALPDSSEASIPDLISEMNASLNGLKTISDKEFVSVSHSLYRHLVEPIKELLDNKEKLIIIPHKDLNILAFETLIQEIPRKKIKYKKLDYLIRDYSISYEMSADFMVQKEKTSRVLVNSISIWAPEGKPDHSDNEATDVLKTFTQKNLKGKVFLKTDATEDQFKNEAFNYNQVHIISPGFGNVRQTQLSGLALVPSEGEDGILSADEVMNMDFSNTGLVVLNKSDWSMNDSIQGNGSLPLCRTFLFAGVDHILSNQWKTSNEVSTQMMVYFYKKVLTGANYPEALQYAKLRMIRKSKTSNPKIWAVYTLLGF